MVKRTKNIADGRIDKLNEKDTLAKVKPISTLLSNRIQKSKDKQFYDDLIVSLADAYENKRARQVFEWESLRRRSV